MHRSTAPITRAAPRIPDQLIEERSMTEPARPARAVEAAAVPSRKGALHLPEPFARVLSRRVKHPLGDHFGLKAFGVNLTRLAAGDAS
jgi:hypothetical protein